MIFNSCSSCLHLPSSKITGMSLSCLVHSSVDVVSSPKLFLWLLSNHQSTGTQDRRFSKCWVEPAVGWGVTEETTVPNLEKLHVYQLAPHMR